MSDEIKNELQVLDDVAEKRRLEKVNEIESQDQPEFITNILQTEIAYVIHPTALPYEQSDLTQFASLLNDLYGLDFRQREKPAEDDNPLAAILGQNERSDVLVFENGKFTISNRDFIPIKRIRLTTEQIHIVLGGDSSVGETIIADIVEALWKSTNINKSWSEIQDQVQIKSYGTATKVDFGTPLEEFLNPKFKEFLDNEFVNGKMFGKHMIPYSGVNDFKLQEKAFASYVLDDLNLLFNLFNPMSGESYQAKLQFRVTAKHEYGSGQYTVVSELPFDLHIECLQMLKAKFA